MRPGELNKESAHSSTTAENQYSISGAHKLIAATIALIALLGSVDASMRGTLLGAIST
eukprot:CAMPEP_0172555810 /NCGR_PEP_ID=MMETSP1067-20121228/60402_1 /TAXON_ID=265564 ORGANISM="Thalassiosira punctigera, Strain Tpunct2005C2" /NCGR_SAMPLE_ID=MMETSP1067 /ASSEMBLY_ACC=CAM_ASM_000444 /LENGTH=57 /DNA_ID=CAMNT_0013344415 /DNA_START=24 /DNA_END=195 /DNA_ORIENTATION=+